MNLYVPNAQLDAPFGYGDLEWLYRQQDVDGGSLVSRLAQLAPVSFSNTIDGQRRRRLFALDSWEMNNFVWSNDNPVMANPNAPPATITPFANNATFAVGANAGFPYLGAAPGLSTPPLAHRDKKINLNYPLPVSNDPDELIRRKWISDTYQLLKWVLPPRAVDTPEELAQLSQFVINIIDFRDPDCTMTHWRNPDVLLVPGQPANPPGSAATPATAPTLVLASSNPANAIPLDQYGMEYNPVALNEVLAFSYAYQVGSQANRFFVELVNTLTQSAFAALPSLSPPDPSILDLGGLQYTPGDPYSGGCWDLVFTDDTLNSRPDPYRGELVLGGQFYALIPLNKDSFTASPAGATAGSSGSDVTLVPLPASTPPTPPTNIFYPTNFFYAFGNSPANPALETWTPSLVQYLSPSADPFNGPATPKITWYPGVLPGVVADPGTSTWSAPPIYQYQSKLPTLPTLIAGSQQTTKYYWVCLRRPANPFAPVSAANPMLVVDAMRFPYIYGTVTGSTGNMVYSAQRFQPYRGGHAVPVPVPVTAGTPAGVALDTRYGYTEQIAGSAAGLSSSSGPQGVYPTIYHTLGNDNDQHEPWDYFPFHDRDFTVVAELMLVPGCPPGLFTKQFAEFAPSGTNSGNFKQVVPQLNPPAPLAPASFATAATAFVTGSTGNPVTPHTFPYLVDKFFYSGYGGPVAPATAPPADPGGVVGGYGADGWFKMFEFFEVPSQMIGAVGPVAQGTNFDWLRQDTKPGLINLNLIIDEEVFFSVFGKQDEAFSNATSPLYEQLLSFYQLQPPRAARSRAARLRPARLHCPLPLARPPSRSW